MKLTDEQRERIETAAWSLRPEQHPGTFAGNLKHVMITCIEIGREQAMQHRHSYGHGSIFDHKSEHTGPAERIDE